MKPFPATPTHTTSIERWLWTCIVYVFLIILIGGLTRLAGAGLSIVEWSPVTGTLPPLNEVQWLVEFQKYQAHSEFQKINESMTLLEFKQIFWLEYIHRLWGRGIGLVVFIPFLIFLIKNALPLWLIRRIIVLIALGGAQGLMGWIMVKSGLGDNPHVSPYKLTLHLWLAMGVWGGFIWTLLSIKEKPSIAFTGSDRRWSYFLLGYVICLIGYGALVAGFKAGWIYNTFPLMGDTWLPSDGWDLAPLWKNFFENAVMVQWVHRWGAILFGLLLIIGRLRHPKVVSPALILIGGSQIMLGIITLLHQVPVSLGVLHQGVGMLVFGACLQGAHRVYFSKNLQR